MTQVWIVRYVGPGTDGRIGMVYDNEAAAMTQMAVLNEPAVVEPWLVQSECRVTYPWQVDGP